MKFVTLIPLWFGSVAWHLWRIMTMRPAFKYLGDTALPVVSFALVFIAAGLFREVGLGSAGFFGGLLEQVVYGFVLCLLAERRHRSSSLTVAFLGASTVVDLFACAMTLAGFLSSPQLPLMSGGLWQAALMLAAYVQFRKEPAAVQAAGYRPNGRESALPA